MEGDQPGHLCASVSHATEHEQGTEQCWWSQEEGL